MDGYDRIRVLGTGSFGEAVLLRHIATGELRVAKRVSVSAEELVAATREARVLASLAHENIVAYHASWSEGDDDYLDASATTSPRAADGGGGDDEDEDEDDLLREAEAAIAPGGGGCGPALVILMEYADGGDLSAAIARRKRAMTRLMAQPSSDADGADGDRAGGGGFSVGVGGFFSEVGADAMFESLASSRSVAGR